MKSKRRKGSFFLTIGLLLMAAALALTVYNRWDSDRAYQSSLEVLDALDTVIEENEDGFHLNSYGEGYREMPTVVIDGYEYIGKIQIPCLGLSLPVMNEWDYTRLKISPCRYSGSYYTDDLVIAGHNYARHFSPIKWLELGSEVVFVNVEGEEFHYTVESVSTLNPTQVEEMTTGDWWDLSLFTCNTGGRTRCAVRCVKAE